MRKHERLVAVVKGEDVKHMVGSFFIKMVNIILNMVATYCEIIYVKMK